MEKNTIINAMDITNETFKKHLKKYMELKKAETELKKEIEKEKTYLFSKLGNNTDFENVTIVTSRKNENWISEKVTELIQAAGKNIADFKTVSHSTYINTRSAKKLF